MSVTSFAFGTLSDGQEVQLFTLVNSSGAKVCLSDYGARVVSIFVPGKDGKLDDVVPGPGDVETFEKGDRFMGCRNSVGNRCSAMVAPRVSTVSCGIQSRSSRRVSQGYASIV